MVRSRLGLIGFVLVLLPLVACAEGPYPGDVKWPNGRPVHPRMMPTPPVDWFAANSCVAGLSDEGYGFVEAYAQDPHFLHIDEWTWWALTGPGGIAPTANDCVGWWNSYHDSLTLNYWCGNGLKPYYYNRNVDFIGVFTQYFLCDANGFAYWDCAAAGYCLGIFAAETVQTEPTQPPLPGWPTERTMNDPTNPNPPVPYVCTRDPYNPHVCLEDRPQQ